MDDRINGEMNPGGTDARVAAGARRRGPGGEMPDGARPRAAAARRAMMTIAGLDSPGRRRRPGADVRAGRGTREEGGAVGADRRRRMDGRVNGWVNGRRRHRVPAARFPSCPLGIVRK